MDFVFWQAQGAAPIVHQLDPVFKKILSQSEGCTKYSISICSNSRLQNKIARADFVPEGLALLRNSKRHVRVQAIYHVLKVGKNALSGLWTQVGNTFIGSYWANRCF